MRQNARIAVIIPALNEERAIGHVLEAVPGWVDEVIVVDNGSRDQTVAVAQSHGARVILAGTKILYTIFRAALQPHYVPTVNQHRLRWSSV